METDKLNDNLFWLFMKASLRAKKGFMKMADTYDLTIIQLYAICYLEPDKPMSMKGIADFLNCDASNVTGIIDRLFSQHYLTRQENPADRRVKRVQLTAEGEKLRQKVINGILSYQSEALDNLNQKDQDQLKQILLKVLG